MAKGDSNDPTWAYVTSALARAGAFAAVKGFHWVGISCYLVSAAALDLVMATRNEKSMWMDGQPPLKTNDPHSASLAYADHYLHMRGEGARVGHAGAPFLYAQTKGYDAVKGATYALKDLPTNMPDMNPRPYTMLPDWALAGEAAVSLIDTIPQKIGADIEYKLRENKANPLSRPSEDSQYWGLEGLADGLDDWKRNPDWPGAPAFRARPF